MSENSLPIPRVFELVRMEDLSGVSGTGVVAQGVDFGDKAVLYWLGEFHTVGIYDNLQALETIHGHEGRTVIRWIDPPVESSGAVRATEHKETK